MALTKCSDCGKEVSESAPACPYCGCPIKATTVEQTGKMWKRIKLISLGMLILGFILIVDKETAGLGGAMIALAPIVFIAAKLGSWWYHG